MVHHQRGTGSRRLAKEERYIYHSPYYESWSFIACLNPKDNLLVVFEEEIANPEKVEILTVNRDTICSFVTENHPPNVKSWAVKSEKFHAVVNDLVPSASLKCPHHKTIKAVEFASFGDPAGVCGAYALGKCNAPAIKQIVEKQCLGKESCLVPIDKDAFTKGQDACPNVTKALAIQVRCE